MALQRFTIKIYQRNVMPTPQQRLMPPTRFGDVGQLEEILWANLPQIAAHMAGLFGRRTPRLRKKFPDKE